MIVNDNGMNCHLCQIFDDLSSKQNFPFISLLQFLAVRDTSFIPCDFLQQAVAVNIAVNTMAAPSA